MLKKTSRFSNFARCLLFLFPFIILTFVNKLYSQQFTLKGNVTTDSGAVSSATIIFINQGDTSQKYTTVTNTDGNYSIRKEAAITPKSFELGQNYPNPFSTQTQIPYRIIKQSNISIKIYDILGREVRTFSPGIQYYGAYGITWDGKNNLGIRVAPGVYIYRMQSDHETEVKKIVFIPGIAELQISNQSNSFSGLQNSTAEILQNETIKTKADTFKVTISNNVNTSPEIINKEYDDIIIQSDTTLNFTVDKAENLNLYVGTYGGNNLFVVDVDYMRKQDSLYFQPGGMWLGLYITPGGSKLYFKNVNDKSHPVYYLDTKTMLFHPTNLSFYSSIYFNKGKGFLFDHSGIYSLDTLTDQITQIDTITLGQFISFDKTLPVIYFLKNYELYFYGYQQRKITDSLAIPGMWETAMTPDSRELYFTSPDGRLGVINIQTGAGDYLGYVNPNGNIAISHDGKYVLVTDPGSHFGPDPGSGLITIVRTSDHKLDGYINNVWMGENIVITPDNSLAIVNDDIGIYFINIPQKRILKYFRFYPYGATLGSIVLGQKPK